MKIRIHVTDEVLRKSMYCPLPTEIRQEEELENLRNNCAIGVAVKDLFPNAVVFQSCAFLLGTQDVDSMVKFSRETIQFVKSFDDCLAHRERLMLPEHSFEIEVPDSVIEKIGLEEVQKILSESKTLEQVETTN